MLNITETGFGRLSVFIRALLACCALLAVTAASAATNHAPVISGNPASSVAVGVKYYFKPTAMDSDTGTKLTYAISHRPSWATFSSVNGALQGYPKAEQIGLYSDIVVSVSDGKIRRSLPAFSIRVTKASTTSNAAPKISGSPAQSVQVGAAYRFQPSASDANGDKLIFSISNKPAWASFNTSTGLVSGTPAAAYAGTSSNIVIRVSDGKASAALPSFAITVTQNSNGSATVSWIPPTQNIDGSAITNLAGHRIRYGTNRSALSQTATVSNVGITRYVIENLTSGTWYFAVQAYNRNGQESALSPLTSKTIR